uniref:Terpene cyclase/mutase family member n=1 Tax=Oryza nivara TaxID=4536 RepID=A0A0E0J0U0_ORYNI
MAVGPTWKKQGHRELEDKAQRVLLSLLLQRAMSMVMKGQRDGEPSCSSLDCVQEAKQYTMWKLKFGEGASDPLLRSSNGFLGRETWEFDPNGGSPEEHAVVERLRRDFTRNRFTQRECSDLLMRMQEQNQVYSKHEVSNLKDSSEVTEEVLLTSLRRVLDQYSSLQAPDGYWPGGYSGILFILPLMNEDGGWSTHTLGPSSMFGSCVNYATLRLLGEVLDEHNDGLSKGRAWILSHGSATVAPQWAKIYLSGTIQLFQNYGCFHIFFPFIQDDIIYPPSWFQNIAMASLHKFMEPLFNMWPMNKIRKRALTNLMDHIHYEDENSNYVGLCPINKVLNMVCCWIENPNSNAFRRHLPRIHDFLWLAEDGMKSKVYVGSQCWDTALIVQAYCSTGLTQEFSETIKKAHDFIKNAQVTKNCPNYKRYYRERSKGGVVVIKDSTNPSRRSNSRTKVNKDGTLSSAESKRTTPWVEFINPSESFRNIIVDYPYVECTSSLIQALILFKGVHPGYRREEIDRIIKNGVLFIEKKQKNDGSWTGCGRKNIPKQFACNFLLSKQLSTGGWGEDYLGCQVEEYIDSGRPHVVHTAWGMLGLIYAGQVELDPAPLYRAAKELINMQLETGEFPQQEILGSFNSSLFFNYTNYRNLFPIWALGEFHRRLLAKRA